MYDNNSQYIDVACAAVREAGKAVMSLYGTGVEVEQKADRSAVTEADRQANDILVRALSETGIPVLSEEVEDDAVRLESDHVWIIDPLDGTNDFLEQTDEFAIMVGLAKEGAPVLGVVYLPATDTLYYAQKGMGAFAVRGREGSGEESRLSVSTGERDIRAVTSRSHESDEARALYKALGVVETIPVGSNGVKIGRIAEGGAEVFVNPTDKMGEWDGCAPQIILEEAGGKMTGVGGSPITYNKKKPNLPQGILATNGALHPATLSAHKQVEE